MPETATMEIATFAAGCFWGVEELFRAMPGVTATRVGYTGGTTDSPTYDMVCTDQTGHAEAVEVTFDPSKVSYGTLLQTFWDNHNPTTPNQQGPDYGSQYRSAVFYHSDEQRRAAEEYKLEVQRSGRWKNPVVTQIVAAQRFYEAEAYHQQYLRKRGLGSCHV